MQSTPIVSALKNMQRTKHAKEPVRQNRAITLGRQKAINEEEEAKL
jgi:hypothetical protein